MRLAHKVATSAAVAGCAVAARNTRSPRPTPRARPVLRRPTWSCTSSKRSPADAATRIANAGGALVHSVRRDRCRRRPFEQLSVRDRCMTNCRWQQQRGSNHEVRERTSVATPVLNEAGSPGDLPNVPGDRQRQACPACSGTWGRSTPRGPGHQRWQPVRRRRRHRHRTRLHASGPAPNVDFANSATCVGGVPNPGPAAADDNGHGTHTAGTIAAARNGIGIVGVAPNVKIAAIKAGNADGYFFPEAVICAFMWAGDAPPRRDEQQLLRRPLALQLPERPGAAGDLEGRAAGDPVRDAAGRDRRRGAGKRERGPLEAEHGLHQSRQPHAASSVR